MQKLSIAQVQQLAASFVDVQSRGDSGEFYSNQALSQGPDMLKVFWATVEELEH